MPPPQPGLTIKPPGQRLALDGKTSWSNYNALQANYQRLFHNGYAYEISYTWSNAMRTAGTLYPAQDYAGTNTTVTSPYGTLVSPVLPPARPADVPSYASYHDLNQFENYIVDTATPKQHIMFNGIVDLPIGRGKKLFGNANRLVNEIIGGFQIAGDGNIVSQDFTVTSSNLGPTNPLKVYKHKASITDCRSGVCRQSYLWFDGYIAPSAISGNPCATTTAVVSGLPSDYAPYQSLSIPIAIRPMPLTNTTARRK